MFGSSDAHSQFSLRGRLREAEIQKKQRRRLSIVKEEDKVPSSHFTDEETEKQLPKVVGVIKSLHNLVNGMSST